MPQDASQVKNKRCSIHLCMKEVHGSSVRVHEDYYTGSQSALESLKKSLLCFYCLCNYGYISDILLISHKLLLTKYWGYNVLPLYLQCLHLNQRFSQVINLEFRAVLGQVSVPRKSNMKTSNLNFLIHYQGFLGVLKSLKF